ncbi:MAG TPA: Spy/CpxP family protein refolding chaperone [Vicinamibacterales bacterium]|nr:Spy/CpxP family protein refolding chaperone [Vicinamibacterales bacterium]
MNVYSIVPNRRRLAVVALLAWAGMAGSAWAQPSRAPWWKDEKSKAELKLTEEQADRIDAIFKDSWHGMRSSYEELGKREEQLSALVSAADTTEADVIRQVEQVEAVRGELNKVRTVMLYRMHRILTPDQRGKLDEMRRQRDRDRPRSGSRPPARH